jgi:vacuolar-type H+-ATPase subunit E/Vma4
MAEDIKGLIEKINSEGIQAAQEKARQIQTQAQLKAEQLIKEARVHAQQIIAEAEEEAHRTAEKERVLMKQAGRDFLLLVRSEINAMLDKLVVSEVRHALDPEALSHILGSIMQNIAKHPSQEVVVTLSKEDMHKLNEEFLGKLKEAVKKQVVLRPSEEIRAGFVISFDAGKSQFDFSDKALAEYITVFLKPKLQDIFKD